MLGQPSVIARLMGMEGAIQVPVAATDAIPVTMIRSSSETITLLKPSSSEAPTKITSQFKQFKCSPLSHSHHIRSLDYYRYCLNKMRPRRARRSRHHHRHHPHPQEELLHKIKEEFQAWQASKAPENVAATTVAGASGRSGNASLDGRYIQMIAQENLRKEKMTRYGCGAGKSKVEDEVVATENVAEQHGNAEAAEAQVAKPEERVMEAVTVINHRAESEEFFRGLEEAVKGEHEDHRSSVSVPEKLCGTPIRIAILRPSTDADDHREPVFGVTPKAKRDGDMEGFLQEVKERLKNEMKVKFSSDPKQTARDMAKKIRQTIMSKDLGKKLHRSESFRVFRGDRRRDAAAARSPEHRLLKSVMARIETMSPKKTKQELTSSLTVTNRARRFRSLTDASLSGTAFDDQQSCTSDQQCLMKLQKVDGVARTDADVVVLSPRALVRSFSAPASSGSSRVRQGASDTSSEGAEVISRSSSFSVLRGTVTGLRRSFSLGGKLLLMHWSKNPSSSPQDSGCVTVAQANFFAGLPPSPVSPLEVEGHSSRHFSTDFNCSFPELSPKWSPKCSSEFDAPMSESSWKTSPAPPDAESNPDNAYIREVLITAGLYDDDGGSSDGMAIGRTASMSRPIIGDDVFEEVEDAYYYYRSRDKNCAEEHGTTDHRLLFDLANEALQALRAGRGARAAGSSGLSLRRWVVVDGGVGGKGAVASSRGRELLGDEVWRQVVESMANGATQAVDCMAECEVGRSAWIEVSCEDVCAVGTKIERAILDELISEVFV